MGIRKLAACDKHCEVVEIQGSVKSGKVVTPDVDGWLGLNTIMKLQGVGFLHSLKFFL